MVLRPIESHGRVTPEPMENARPVPAWDAIAARQEQRAESYLLIAQPDHAQLAGDLAENFVSPLYPKMNRDVVRCIAMHDAGWAILVPESNPASEPMMTCSGKPRSFIEFTPVDFIPAWKASIDRAQALSAVGCIMVSRHFCWLAEFRLKSVGDSSDEKDLVVEFLKREKARQQLLLNQGSILAKEADELLKVLQFCDLLSLYLCCGATDDVEFPQVFASRRVRLTREDELYSLDPSPFQYTNDGRRTVSLAVVARPYPSRCEPHITTVPFLLR